MAEHQLTPFCSLGVQCEQLPPASGPTPALLYERDPRAVDKSKAFLPEVASASSSIKTLTKTPTLL